MADILKISAVFVAIIFLLKRKLNVGLVMMLSSVMLAVLYTLGPAKFAGAVIRALANPTTISLLAALTLIRVFENIIRKKGLMQNMMASFRGMIMDRRVVMASMPALIGLLPSMGGALFSAPMVEEASKDIEMPPEKKAFINYWFRHPWEFILPLYPGLVLCSAITAFPLRDLILFNLPGALSLLAGGMFWGLAGVKTEKEVAGAVPKKGLASFIPLGMVLLLVIAFHLDLSVSIGVVIVCLFAVLRYSFRDIALTFREGFSWDIVSIIVGVMSFKSVMEVSGAVANLSAFFSEAGIPVLPVLFIIPFISGLLTGLTVGFIGGSFPILIGLEHAQNLGAISFSFASGYLGVLLSPVHLCLVLTREYFKANMSDIYRLTIRAGLLIFLSALAWYFISSAYFSGQ